MRKLVKIVAAIVAAMIVLWVALILRFGNRSEDVLSALVIGWAPFLKRSVEGASMNWSGIGMVVACSIVVWLLIQKFTRSQRRTGAVFGGFWLLFILSMAVSGIVSKARELIESDEPMMVRRENPYVTVRNAHLAVRIALTDEDEDVEKVRKAMGKWRATKFGQREWEDLNVVIVGDDGGKVLAAAFVPRTPKRGFGVLVGGNDFSGEFLPEYAGVVMAALAGMDGEKSNETLEKRLMSKIPEAAWVRRAGAAVDVRLE